jgi:hypothetical protein
VLQAIKLLQRVSASVLEYIDFAVYTIFCLFDLPGDSVFFLW